MNMVYQTKFGPDDGNCFSACVAAVMELGLEEVPEFVSDSEDMWFTNFKTWLEPFGLDAMYVDFKDRDQADIIHLTTGYCIAMGKKKNDDGIKHAVVIKDATLVLDPLPGSDGLGDIEQVMFFLKKDPSQCRKIEEN